MIHKTHSVDNAIAKARPVAHPGRWVSAVVVGILAAMIIHGLIYNPNYQWDIVIQWLFSKTVVTAVKYTLILTVLSMALGTAIAVLMAVMRQSPNPVLRSVSWFYIWFFRGTPVYTQLIFWSLLPILYPTFSLGIPFGPEFVSFDTDRVLSLFWMAVLGLSFNEGAYLAEIFRAGLNSVDKGQEEAAVALGMSHGKIMRRIILPQAMRVIIPPLGNETISMLKTTSLVAAIPYTAELTYVAKQKGSELFAAVPLLICAAIWYLLITSILMLIQRHLEAYYGKSVTTGNAKKTNKLNIQEAIAASNTVSNDPFLEVTP